jgi:hypothetical protein
MGDGGMGAGVMGCWCWCWCGVGVEVGVGFGELGCECELSVSGRVVWECGGEKILFQGKAPFVHHKTLLVPP